MSYYKIKNVTGKLPKRHINKDMKVKIEYHVGFQKKYHELNADNEIVLSCRKLPVSIQSLRAKQLINVIEISENEFNRLQKPSAKKPVKKPISTKIKSEPIKKHISTKIKTEPVPKKKMTSKKKTESTVTVKEEI